MHGTSKRKPGRRKAGRGKENSMLRPHGPSRLGWLALLGCLAAVPAARGRELHWRSLDVHARLDASGALHVVERHAMVFTGDWNGGERKFRIFPGQRLTFEGLARIDADGQAHGLSPGDLSAVDEFAWKDPTTLRWRSRLPTDPPFQETELVYEISYVLTGALVKEANRRYVLDHDFAFPDRTGAIERFDLDLSLDPAWKPEGRLPGTLSRGPLPPGEGVVLRIPLAYEGTGHPAVSRAVAGAGLRLAAFLVLLGATLFLYGAFRAREKRLGRYGVLTPPGSIDRGWLEDRLFPLAPEEAGALWDETIGPPEVASVLARLAAEKKIETHAEGKKKLSMRLLEPLDGLKSYDQELLRGFFFDGRTQVDTDAIRSHYRSSGFDPVSRLRPSLERRLQRLPDFGDRSSAPPRWPTPILIGVGLLLLLLSVLTGEEQPGTVVGIGILHAVVYGIGALCAYAFQKRVDRLDAFSPVFLWAPLFLLYLSWSGTRGGGAAGPMLVLAVLLVRIGILNGIFNVAKTRNGPKRIARRKDLASARAFFARELKSRSPHLSDDWFPYIVAFGLTGEADRWFHAYGSAVSGGAGIRTYGGSGSASAGSGSSGSGGWTGGGGSFGGAGASGSWAAAAGALAAGVAAPSSSGGGGGGGGGGGSSGGGGGGGW
jgi:uncharacterized membrane protein YgcG